MPSFGFLESPTALVRQLSGGNESLLEDMESAVEYEQPERREADAESSEAKLLAREKFDWLTSHALVAKFQLATRESEKARSSTVTVQRSSDRDVEGQQETTLRHRLSTDCDITPVTPAAYGKMSSPGSYRSAAKYLSACARYSLTPNGGALLCLSLGLEMLEVDGSLTNLELVPLCAALLDATFVQHLKLSGHPLQDTGAAVLALALPGCPWIRELELVACNITGAGVRSICDSLPKSSVSRLVLRGNLLRQNATPANTALASVVSSASQLTSLDLQSCGLKSEGMRMIKRSLVERDLRGFPTCTVDFEGNFVLVEVLNSVSHGACALVCVEAWRRMNILVIRLCHFESRFALTLFTVSMLLMFTGSTLYHSMFALTHISWFFRMIDHCAIYFLIAGTYTPVVVLGCRNPDTMKIQRAVPEVVSIYWVLVAFGIFMEHIFAVQKPSWYSKFVLGMYVTLGFGGVPYIATCPIVHEGDVMSWIELGGLTYVIGLVFFLLDKRYPAMHVIWHILVGLAAFFHFVGVWNLTDAVLRDPHRSCSGQNLWESGAIAAVLGWDPAPDGSSSATTSVSPKP